MTKSLLLLAALMLATPGPMPVGQAQARDCHEGVVKFGKLVCGTGTALLVQGYFYGVSSLEEIATLYPERYEKLRDDCEKKVAARAPAALRARVEAMEVCSGKRGYQEPCVRNEDCLENVCHPVRGTCSKVTTFPIPFGP